MPVLEMVQIGFTTIGAVVSGASVIVAALDKVAAITPTDRDDKALAAVTRCLGAVSFLLDKVSIWQWKK